MKTKIIHNQEEFFKLKDEWDELLGRSGVNHVFMTHEWLSAWWETFGAGNDLFIVTVKEGEKLQAIGPFMITTKKKLQFIGHEVSDYLDLIVAEKAEECFKLIFEEIAQNQQHWIWADFAYLLKGSANFKYWRENLVNSNNAISLITDDCPAVVLDLGKTASWNEYEKLLPAKRRNDLKRCLRLLNEKGKLTFSRISDFQGIADCFGSFVANHKRRWHEEGMGSQFDGPVKIKHYLDIAKKLAPRRWIEMAALKLDDKYVAMAFGYVYCGRYYYYTPTFDPDYWKFSPGNILIKYLIEDFYAEGKVKVFDLLRGNEPYKYVWTKDEIALCRAQLYTFSAGSLWVYAKRRLALDLFPKLKKIPYLKKFKHYLIRAGRKLASCCKL